MAALEAKKPAADEARGLPEIVRLGRRNSFEAIIFRQQSQASAHISARAERHLSEVEWRLSRLGDEARTGRADCRLVVDRIRAALVREGLDAGGLK